MTKKRQITDHQYQIIDRIAKEHSGKNKCFGYLDQEDLRNEIWLICLQLLSDFDSDRGNLEHFLRVGVHNRLVNKFKKITNNVKPPCPRCPYYDKGNNPDCARFGHDKNLCDKWCDYQLSLDSRNSLLYVIDVDADNSILESTILNDLVHKESIENIRNRLPKKYIEDFNHFINGQDLAKLRFKKLQEMIMQITKEDENANSKEE